MILLDLRLVLRGQRMTQSGLLMIFNMLAERVAVLGWVRALRTLQAREVVLMVLNNQAATSNAWELLWHTCLWLKARALSVLKV